MIHVLLSLVVSHRWPLRQLDMSNAFLNGTLTEDIYMAQLLGFIDSARPQHICKLHKSLYGLKQAPQAWFHTLAAKLFNFGFKGSSTDPSLFINCSAQVYVLVYVDDLIITGSSTAIVQ